MNMYFITCFEQYGKDNLGWINIGAARTFGYYKDKDVALEAVKKNWCDIQERLYRYAVVEYIEEGLYNPATERWFFEWDEDEHEFVPINPLVDNQGNYALG
jgi:hypothetical protein